MKITRVTRTSMSIPAQWDAWDEDGRYYFLCLRNGYGSVTRYEDENWARAEPPQRKELISGFEHDAGEGLGRITIEEFARLAGIELADDVVRTSFSEYVSDELVMTYGHDFSLAMKIAKSLASLGD